MGKFEDDGLVIDHINHNTLDNRKHNLRICTESDNSKNKSLPSNNTSGVVGISFNKKYNKYETYITINYKRKSLGLYDSIEDAIKTRKDAEEKYFGEYSYDNSMELAMKNNRKDKNMNKELRISLNEFSKIQKFNNIITNFESDIDLVRGRYVIDAKSIIGIYTLDLSKPIDVVINSDDDEEIIRFNNVMKEFV